MPLLRLQSGFAHRLGSHSRKTRMRLKLNRLTQLIMRGKITSELLNGYEVLLVYRQPYSLQYVS